MAQSRLGHFFVLKGLGCLSTVSLYYVRLLTASFFQMAKGPLTSQFY